MGQALRKDDVEVRYTYADYKGWDLKPGERYELIHGAAYAMSAPSDYHQSISGEIFRQIANYLAGKPDMQIYAATDKVEVGIFPGFAVDLAPVFAEDV